MEKYPFHRRQSAKYGYSKILLLLAPIIEILFKFVSGQLPCREKY
jgi:hypothetical protein